MLVDLLPAFCLRPSCPAACCGLHAAADITAATPPSTTAAVCGCRRCTERTARTAASGSRREWNPHVDGVSLLVLATMADRTRTQADCCIMIKGRPDVH